MISEWPKVNDALNFSDDAARMEQLMDAIRAIRNRRAEMNVPPSKKAALIVVSENAETRETFEAGRAFLTKLAYASEIAIMSDAPENASSMVSAVTNAASLYIPMDELIDRDKEIERLTRERERAMKDYNMITGKLNNEGFVARAPQNVVDAEREKLERVNSLLAKIDESLARLQG